MDWNDQDKLVQHLVTKTGKESVEIQELIQKKVEKFSGMLSSSGATFLVAKDFGIDLELGKNLDENLKINQLEEGMKNVSLELEIKHLFALKEFSTNGKAGKMVSMIVGDDSGECGLTLWNQETNLIGEMQMARGNKISLKNGFVRAYNSKLQLSLGFNGKIELLDKSVVAKKLITLQELQDGMKEVCLEATIARKFPLKEFEANSRKGKLVAFELSQGGKMMRAVAWNELAESMEKIPENQAVRIENGVVKKGIAELELHLNYRSEIRAL